MALHQWGGFHDNSWGNISNSVQRIIVPLKSELVMGDNNTGSDVFDSLGFGGARLYSVDWSAPAPVDKSAL